MSKAPLRRTRGDLIATGVIAAVSVIALLIAFITAPIRQDHLTPAAEEIPNGGMLAIAPQSLTEGAQLHDDAPSPHPLTVAGLIVTYDKSSGAISAFTPDGEEKWSYTRKPELCGMASAWDEVVAVYRTNIGCGDVVSIKASTGQYSHTRSAIAPDEVEIISSNDRIGYVAPARTEIWRSDLVRTVEYGEVEAPQEPDFQPNEACTRTSALTRKEFYAVTEKCDDGSWLRMQKATPEDSRKPEITQSVQITDGSYLVAVSEDAAAVYDPTSSKVASFNQDGNELANAQVPQSDLLSASPTGVANPEVADLPHHMSYFDGENLMLLAPANLAVTTIFPDAVGTGFGAGDRLIYPTPQGIAVANWDTNTIDRVIPVDRHGYSGPVSISSAGATVVEKRGTDIAVLDLVQ